MEETGDKSVNTEVYRLLRENVSNDKQDTFLKTVTKYIAEIPEGYRIRFVNFIATRINEVKGLAATKDLYALWVDAFAKEKRDRALLGEDY
jgi:hypothetical protein